VITKGPTGRKFAPRLTVAYYVSADGQGGSSHYSVKDGDETVARIGTGQVATAADEEWARLFAAAPDLLEACHALLLASPDHRQGFPLWSDMEAGGVNYEQALKHAYRAIRKAERAMRGPSSTEGTTS
jgi:hypothetical protein